MRSPNPVIEISEGDFENVFLRLVGDPAQRYPLRDDFMVDNKRRGRGFPKTANQIFRKPVAIGAHSGFVDLSCWPPSTSSKMHRSRHLSIDVFQPTAASATTVKHEPRPTAERSSTRCPTQWAARLSMNSTSPRPSERVASSRKKGSNTLATLSGAMPSPVS